MPPSSPTKPTIVDRLVAKYSPPLDSSLVLAIALDHLGSPEAELEASKTLDALLFEVKSEAATMSATSGMSTLSDTALASSDPDTHLLPYPNGNRTRTETASASTESRPTEEDYITTTGSTGESALSASAMTIDKLQTLFPDQPAELLRAAIAKASDPEDLEEVANLMLSAQDASRAAVLPGPTSPTSPTAGKHQAKKKGKRALQKFHLTDVMHGDSRARIREAAAYEPPQPLLNAWATNESEAMYLANLLAIEPAKIQSAYHARNCNLVLALEDILQELEPQRRNQLSVLNAEQMETQLAFLQANASEGQDADVLRRLLVVAHLDAGVAFDLLEFLKDLTKRRGTVQFNFFHNLPADLAPSTSRPSVPPGDTAWTTVRSPMAADARPAYSPSSMDYQAMILALKSERDAKLAKASEAHRAARSGPATNRLARAALPMVYSHDAQRLAAEIREWEIFAAQACVNQRQRARGDIHSIDLHGLTRNQALAVTRDAVHRWWNSSHTSPRRAFKIITGAGTHSHNSIPVLLPAITNFLDQNGYKWKYEDLGGGGRSGKVGAVYVIDRRRS